MKLPPAIEEAVVEARARIRVGYPWWLKPLMARNVIGITLGRRIYLNRTIALYPQHYLERLLRHELVHVAQVNRHGLPLFLWKYVTEFGRHWWRTRSPSRAYRLISFEVEAAAAEEAYNYGTTRLPE